MANVYGNLPILITYNGRQHFAPTRSWLERTWYSSTSDAVQHINQAIQLLYEAVDANPLSVTHITDTIHILKVRHTIL
jgi:hypothetical protein